MTNFARNFKVNIKKRSLCLVNVIIMGCSKMMSAPLITYSYRNISKSLLPYDVMIPVLPSMDNDRAMKKMKISYTHLSNKSWNCQTKNKEVKVDFIEWRGSMFRILLNICDEAFAKLAKIRLLFVHKRSIRSVWKGLKYASDWSRKSKFNSFKPNILFLYPL